MLDRAHSLGLDFGQGYIFAAPLDADHAMYRVARENTGPEC